MSDLTYEFPACPVDFENRDLDERRRGGFAGSMDRSGEVCNDGIITFDNTFEKLKEQLLVICDCDSKKHHAAPYVLLAGRSDEVAQEVT